MTKRKTTKGKRDRVCKRIASITGHLQSDGVSMKEAPMLLITTAIAIAGFNRRSNSARFTTWTAVVGELVRAVEQGHGGGPG